MVRSESRGVEVVGSVMVVYVKGMWCWWGVWGVVEGNDEVVWWTKWKELV